MINISDLKEWDNACIFIRHGEKDECNYGLTDKGKVKIIEFSEELCVLNRKIYVCSSPDSRCVETANIINNIVNASNGEVYISNILGKPGIQVKDETKYKMLTDSMRCREIFKEWKRGMHLDAMNSPEKIKRIVTDFLIKTSIKNGITIYISQSGTVACTGYSLGLADYEASDEDWVRFLDGYVVRL